MAFINKQAILRTLADADTDYLPKADSQVRAFTIHNPTPDNIDLTVSANALPLVTKTVTAGATEVISQLFNQQLNKDEPFAITGTGLNVMITVVEITG